MTMAAMVAIKIGANIWIIYFTLPFWLELIGKLTMIVVKGEMLGT